MTAAGAVGTTTATRDEAATAVVIGTMMTIVDHARCPAEAAAAIRGTAAGSALPKGTPKRRAVAGRIVAEEAGNCIRHH